MESLFFDEIFEAFVMPFYYLLDTGKRVYWLYLISSLIIARFVYQLKNENTSFFKTIFTLNIWFGKSARIDYGLIFLNAFVKVFLVAPMLVGVAWIANGLAMNLTQEFGVIGSSISKINLVILYTFCLVIVNDFFAFLVHYAFHFFPFLWNFHKVHHSANCLNPFTQYRIHPVELIVNNIRGIIIKGCLTGVFMYWAGGKISLITFLGVNVLNFFFLFTGANLRHTHIKFTYFNFLERILISPYQHQIHHSNDSSAYNKNMGSRLAIWDWMFGTLLRSKEVQNISFGLGVEDENYDTFWKNLWRPFVAIFGVK